MAGAVINLRPYQSKIIDETRIALRSHPAVMIQLATGGGKTCIAATMLGTARERGKRAWFLAHRDFLLEQTSRTFDAVGIPHAFIAAGRMQDASEAIQIVSVQTLGRRLRRYQPPDLIVWDEAHHVAARTYRQIREWSNGARHIGLSATPARLDGKGLDKYFGAIVLGPSVSELIREGYLSAYRAFAPSSHIHLEGLHTVAGDYDRGELASVMDTGQIIGDMVRHYKSHAGGKRALYFAVSINHSQHIAATFQAAGVPAIHLDGNSTTAERIQAAQAFARGDIRVISNVDLFGEGYDLASQAGLPSASEVTIEAVGLARPTQSLALHLQQVGRALRPKPEPAIILDHAGNLLRHGLPDQPRTWTLAGIERGKKKDATTAPIRQCMKCFAVCSASCRACPECGTLFEIIGREVEEVAGELREIDRLAEEAARKDEQRRERSEIGQAKTREALEAIARQRGYKPGWVDYIMKAREAKKVTAPIRDGASIREWKGELERT